MHHRHSNDSLLLSLMFVLAVHATLKFLAVVVTQRTQHPETHSACVDHVHGPRAVLRALSISSVS
jgi:hypothetical protein